MGPHGVKASTGPPNHRPPTAHRAASLDEPNAQYSTTRLASMTTTTTTTTTKRRGLCEKHVHMNTGTPPPPDSSGGKCWSVWSQGDTVCANLSLFTLERPRKYATLFGRYIKTILGELQVQRGLGVENLHDGSFVFKIYVLSLPGGPRFGRRERRAGDTFCPAPEEPNGWKLEASGCLFRRKMEDNKRTDNGYSGCW